MREADGSSVVQSWRALLDGGPVAGLDDGPLLERFAGSGQAEAAEAAFAALVARHGPMVRRVCRGVLADPHDADDAFQATFLVLARKARAIRRPERLAGWLHGTASRASRRLRADLARRRRHEAARPNPRSESDPDRSEEASIVLDEVASLPTECRVAVVLCDLEGLTQEEAAGRLGCSDRTLRRRLARAHDLLRSRLTRRGVAPPGLVVVAIGSDPIPGAIIDATARAAARFASGQGTAGLVPALNSAVILAEGVLGTMTWAKIKTFASVAGCLLALGGGVGIASGFLSDPKDNPAGSKPATKVQTQAVVANPSAAERYKALVKRWDDALKAYQAEAANVKKPEDVGEIWMRMGPFAKDYSPAFVALAEEFPADPVAFDALMWVAQQGLSSFYNPDDPGGRAFARALEILARDHANQPRIGEYCPMLTWTPTSIKEAFLRTVAATSQDRVVQGRATLALAEYLRAESALAELFQGTGLPASYIDLIRAQSSDDELRKIQADPVAQRRLIEENYGRYQANEIKILKRADFPALRLESERAFDRVLAEFADVPATPPIGQPRRETLFNQPVRDTLADVARRLKSPAAPDAPPPSDRYQPLAEAYRAALKKADEAGTVPGRPEPDMKAYIAAAPRWADYGPKMWAIAQARPRSLEGFDALLWITGHPWPFFDSGEERVATLGQAVDVLIRDHLDYLGDHLDDREVAEGFNHWSPMPSPHADRLFRTLFERGKTREIRGRMGLVLARHHKAEADLAESFETRGADPAVRVEVAFFPPSYVAYLHQAGPKRLGEEAATILERVKADYGDVPYIYGSSPTGETLATVTDRELADIRTLAVGQVAPEIVGPDVERRPMALSEFRGKVVVLDFGTHEHCGGCKMVYPRQRELVETYKSRPFAILGVNSGDKLDVLKDLLARKEVTWRCWFDGADPLHPGPIFTRWNIKSYPTFIVLDHKGMIRFKDLHPFDPTFKPAIEGLVREAEAARP